MEPTDSPSPEISAQQDALDRADMERLAAGHDAALNDLMARHATPVFHFLCRLVGNEDDANDLAQETFARVFRSCKSFRTGEKFSSWLFAIAANLARNHFRWRRRHPAISLDAESGESKPSAADALSSREPPPNEQILSLERAAAVRAAVQNLPEDLREAIVLCEWQESRVADAAKILGATPKAVESRLYRARRILREKLKDWL